jgi:hypothetical protein
MTTARIPPVLHTETGGRRNVESPATPSTTFSHLLSAREEFSAAESYVLCFEN